LSEISDFVCLKKYIVEALGDVDILWCNGYYVDAVGHMFSMVFKSQEKFGSFGYSTEAPARQYSFFGKKETYQFPRDGKEEWEKRIIEEIRANVFWMNSQEEADTYAQSTGMRRI